MRFLRIFITTALLLTITPAAALADGMIIPFFGTNFGGDTGGLAEGVDADRFTWGASFAWMGGGVIGVEGDIGYSPDFFGKTDVGGSSVLTAMVDLLVGVPFGGQSGFGVRPYGAIGIGIVHTAGEGFDNVLDLCDNKLGWNFGGGLLIFFAKHVGMRGDLRYFRTFETVDLLEGSGGGDLDFTRGSAGFVVRF
jgi:hypothetical protein